ncbi:MAG: hypothetical protein RIE31_00160 [Alphaproteobacteria bacterium]
MRWLGDAFAQFYLAMPLFILVMLLLTSWWLTWPLFLAIITLYSLPLTRGAFATLRRIPPAGPGQQSRLRLTVLTVHALHFAVFVLLAIQGLGFLGLLFGDLSLGWVVSNTINFIPFAPAMAVWPAATLIILLMGLQLLALGLESRLPPALRGTDPVLSVLGRG